MNFSCHSHTQRSIVKSFITYSKQNPMQLVTVHAICQAPKLLTMLVDYVALLGSSTIELNALKRDLMKHRLPDHLKQLAKNVPSQSSNLFGDDTQK